MPNKMIFLTYFYLNKINIFLAIIFIVLILYALLYLTLLLVKINNRNMCTPSMFFILGEKVCNKLIYKTVSDEMQEKLGPVYDDIHDNLNELERRHFTKKVEKAQKTSEDINVKLQYQNLFVNAGKTIEDIKNIIRDINKIQIESALSMRELIAQLKVLSSTIVQNMGIVLEYITYIINISYITPSLNALSAPMTKLYAAIAKYAKLPTKPKLAVNRNTDLFASLKHSKQIFSIQ